MSAPRKKHSLWCYLAATLLVCGMISLPAFGEEQAEQETLYHRLGGLMPISVVVSDFLDAMVPDPFLNQNPAIAEARKRVPTPYLKYQVTGLVCQATGGPCQYTGRSMKDSHSHLNITEEEWDRMLVIFKEVLDKHKVPDPEQQELMAIVDATKADIVMTSGMADSTK